MSKWISIDLLCAGCGLEIYGELVDRGTENEAHPCLTCAGEMRRAYLTPLNNTRRTFVDGTSRPGFKDGKEALRLTAESYNLPPNKREDIKREIHKLKGGKS